MDGEMKISLDETDKLWFFRLIENCARLSIDARNRNISLRTRIALIEIGYEELGKAFALAIIGDFLELEDIKLPNKMKPKITEPEIKKEFAELKMMAFRILKERDQHLLKLDFVKRVYKFFIQFGIGIHKNDLKKMLEKTELFKNKEARKKFNSMTDESILKVVLPLLVSEMPHLDKADKEFGLYSDRKNANCEEGLLDDFNKRYEALAKILERLTSGIYQSTFNIEWPPIIQKEYVTKLLPKELRLSRDS